MAKKRKKRVLVDMVEAGRKGGEARVAKMTPEQLSEAGRKAIQARWAKKAKP